MAEEFDNTNRGALFVNKDKKSPNHPDYRGTIQTDNGQEYWASAWVKVSRNKQEYLSIALTPKDGNMQQQQQSSAASKDQSDFLSRTRQQLAASTAAPAPQRQTDFDSFDDDIPF